jgi:hypothetical protein
MVEKTGPIRNSLSMYNPNDRLVPNASRRKKHQEPISASEIRIISEAFFDLIRKI